MPYPPQPQGILKTTSYDRRVTFGAPQEQLYLNDDQYYEDQEPKKKKKVLRGTRFISGVLGKARKSFDKLNISQTKSTELGTFSSSQSQEWDRSASQSQEWDNTGTIDDREDYESDPMDAPAMTEDRRDMADQGVYAA
jgi:hypothetical protein